MTPFGKRLIFLCAVFFLLFSYPFIGTYDAQKGQSFPISLLLFFGLWLLFILFIMRMSRKKEEE